MLNEKNSQHPFKLPINNLPSSFYIWTPSYSGGDREAFLASPPTGSPLSQCAPPLPSSRNPQSPTQASASDTSAAPSPRRASESPAPSSGISQQHPSRSEAWTECCTATPPPELKTLGFFPHPFSPRPERPSWSEAAELPSLESKFNKHDFNSWINVIN